MKRRRGKPIPRKIDYSVNNGQLNLNGREISITGVKFLGILGKPGANGVVFKAEDEKLSRLIAVKFWIPRYANDAYYIEKSVSEARKLASVNHPSVAQIYDIDKIGKLFYAKLEYIPGTTLRTWLKRKPDFLSRYNMWLDFDDTVRYLHDRDVYHGDLHTNNVLVLSSNIKIIDFGTSIFAKSRLNSLDRESTVLISTVKKVFYAERRYRRLLNLSRDRSPQLTLSGLRAWVETLYHLRKLTYSKRRGDDYGIRGSLTSIGAKIAEGAPLRQDRIIQEMKRLGLKEYRGHLLRQIRGWKKAIDGGGQYHNGQQYFAITEIN